MDIKSLLLIIVISTLNSQVTGAQQATSNASQPAQAQTAPCTAASTPASTTRANNSGHTIIDKWKKKLNDETARIEAQTGVPMPNADDLTGLAAAKTAPCPAKTASPNTAGGAAQPVQVKLPPDISVTIRCNPMTPSPQGGGRQTSLTLPDPKDFALPKTNDFLADSVAPDMAAKTPCYLIKVDPKTGKSFIQQ